MNIAKLLHQSARRLPDRPALAVGDRVVSSYCRSVKRRVQRLSAGLVEKFNLKPGDRVALAMKNCPQYWELLFACWHAGLAAVPMNAKLHAKEFEYIVGNCGAQGPVFSTRRSSRGLDGEPREPPADTRPGRPRLAVLHQRHHRRAQGRDADAPQPAVRGAGLLRRHRQARAAGRDPASGAAVARLGPLRPAAFRRRRGQRDPGERRLRRGGDLRPDGCAGRTPRSSPRRP